MYQGIVYQLTGDTIITKLAIKMVAIVTELLLLCTKQLEYSDKTCFLIVPVGIMYVATTTHLIIL